ncbi:MAG: glycosyltransferase family 2 protein [Alloprevotella sp.]|nr:glycosyltransferase family 2 protein [Alloprevotella sp.]
MKPEVSIIVAVYNAAETLDQCLDSLLGQTDGRVQVICVDDCSTDASADILKRRAEADDRLLLLRTPQNSGLSVARNVAIPYIKGNWVFTVDADDWISADSVEKLLVASQAFPTADILLFRLRKVYPDGREEPFSDWPLYQTFTGEEAGRLAVDWKIHGDYALRPQQLALQPYDARTRVYSDDVTVREHLLTAQRLVQTDAVYYFRQHPASLTHTDGLARLDFIVANTHLREMLESHTADATTLSVAEEYIWRVYVGIQRRLTAMSGSLSPADRERAEQVLSTALQAMRPDRLPKRLRFDPHHLFLRPYGLLRAYTRLLLWYRHQRGRTYGPRE